MVSSSRNVIFLSVVYTFNFKCPFAIFKTLTKKCKDVTTLGSVSTSV